MFEFIPENIKAVLGELEKAGFEAYLVGGCVRDEALGAPPHDYDITTNAKPDEMLRVFSEYRVIETGLKHGTLTVISGGEPVETTTYRIDGEYRDNRRPESVSFTEDITLDLSRRDFTVNAMAYSRRCGLCDPFGGMHDLARKRIVCVGSPEQRFLEDGLRILRALRFSSVLDFETDASTAEAVHSLAYLLCGISRERIFAEIKKLLCGAGAGRICRTFPEVISLCLNGVSAETVCAISEKLPSLPCDCIARLSYIAAETAKAEGVTPDDAAAKIMRSLKSSREEERRVRRIAVHSFLPLPDNDKKMRRLMAEMPEEDILLYAAICASENGYGKFIKLYESVKSENPCLNISSLMINGGDVIRLTGASGQAVGLILKELLECVLDGELENDRETLEKAAAEISLQKNK